MLGQLDTLLSITSNPLGKTACRRNPYQGIIHVVGRVAGIDPVIFHGIFTSSIFRLAR